jgi:hypothetical protein
MKQFTLVCLIGLFTATGLRSQTDELRQVRPAPGQSVERNSLFEMAVPLDTSITKRVQHFLSKGSNGLNPYDPEAIDITAYFERKVNDQWIVQRSAHGFYFQDFRRDTTRNIEDWRWLPIPNGGRFLVRFSPEDIGEWRVRVHRIINKTDSLSELSFVFECNESPISGRLKVGEGNHYFAIDGKTFVPIGNNLAHPRWMNDPIPLRQGTSEYWNDIHEMPAMPISYINFLNDIEAFSESGGNYFRLMHFPFSNDIEFEKLNNYTKRLHIAWETDKMLELCEEKDVKVHFVLTWANELNSPERTYNKLFWDWWGNNYPHVDDDFGYCYQYELGLKDPHEFLTNEKALYYYKKKLRYMFARWGYSRAIGVVELMNEINLVFPDHPKERMYWHREISSYLKNELGIEHPISVNYAGPPDIEKGDSSYFLPTVDVITFNEYRVPGVRSNFNTHLANYKDLNKPFMFSEIGAGYGELADCEVFSEWLKDAWMTVLSGMAGMGLEWSQQRNFALFNQYYPIIKAFIEKEDLALFRDPQADIRKDLLAEVIAVCDTERNKALGVVHNTTWNFYTNRIGDDVPCGQTQPRREFLEYEDVNDKSGRNALHLEGFKKRANFRMDWYNAQTGSLVAITVDKSNGKGRIRLRLPQLKVENALLVFKLYEE